MAGLPEITVAGTLVADPELMFLESGVAVASFTIAANERRFDKTRGEWVDKGATFLRCSVWRQVAEHVAESLSKGTRVLVTGELRQREWTTTTGERRTGVEVTVSEIGASLRWATVTVNKATRSGPGDRAGDAVFNDPPPF